VAEIEAQMFSFAQKFNRRTAVEFSTKPAILPNCLLSAGGIYAIPPPRINLINPKIIAIAHIAIPALAFPFGSPSFLVYATIIIINPRIANGIFIQLKDPRQGINPKNIPHTDKIPITKLAVFINF